MKKLFVLLLIISGCTKEIKRDVADGVTETSDKRKARIPDQIRFTPDAGVYPEGVVYDKFNHRFIVSSFTTGTIGIVTPDGNYTPFIQDPALHATLGLKIDESNQKLLVVSTFFSLDESQLHTAELRVYDLRTGDLNRVTDLAVLRPGVPHLADDLAIDPQGNAYITDAKAPIVYKVDREGNATVLFENQLYAAPPGPLPFFWVGFNGIAYDRSGFLIVGFYAGGKLLKIPIDNPSGYSEIPLNAGLVSPDGLLINKNGKQLIVVDNKYLSPASEIMQLTSNDNWQTAALASSFPTGLVSPTTATTDGKDIFVIYSYAHEIFFGAGPTQREFIIQRLPFDNTQGY
jgi:sugar lactone lactonase YvrE